MPGLTYDLLFPPADKEFMANLAIHTDKFGWFAVHDLLVALESGQINKAREELQRVDFINEAMHVRF